MWNMCLENKIERLWYNIDYFTNIFILRMQREREKNKEQMYISDRHNDNRGGDDQIKKESEHNIEIVSYSVGRDY